MAWHVCRLQDRVIQAYEGMVYMDFDQQLMEKRGYKPTHPSACASVCLCPCHCPALLVSVSVSVNVSVIVNVNNSQVRQLRADACPVHVCAPFRPPRVLARVSI